VIYIAGSTVNIEFLRTMKQRLVYDGHPVNSSWLKTAHQYDDPACTPEHMAAEAPRDVVEIAEADLFIMDRTKKSWGKDTEMGMALVLRCPVWLVGQAPYKNVFFSMASRKLPNWCAVFKALQGTTAAAEAAKDRTRMKARYVFSP